MNLEPKLQIDMDTTNADLAKTVTSLSDIIAEYSAIAIKLSLFADVVPETPEDQKESIAKEIALLDTQAALLETALSSPVKSLEDAKAVLTLWHHEIIQSQSETSLSAADELVNSVYEFLKTA